MIGQPVVVCLTYSRVCYVITSRYGSIKLVHIRLMRYVSRLNQSLFCGEGRNVRSVSEGR